MQLVTDLRERTTYDAVSQVINDPAMYSQGNLDTYIVMLWNLSGFWRDYEGSRRSSDRKKLTDAIGLLSASGLLGTDRTLSRRFAESDAGVHLSDTVVAAMEILVELNSYEPDKAKAVARDLKSLVNYLRRERLGGPTVLSQDSLARFVSSVAKIGV